MWWQLGLSYKSEETKKNQEENKHETEQKDPRGQLGQKDPRGEPEEEVLCQEGRRQQQLGQKDSRGLLEEDFFILFLADYPSKYLQLTNTYSFINDINILFKVTNIDGTAFEFYFVNCLKTG